MKDLGSASRVAMVLSPEVGINYTRALFESKLHQLADSYEVVSIVRYTFPGIQDRHMNGIDVGY